jgi:hypothetical protein
MKAISCWQPWPFAIMRLGKRLENRGRKDGRVPLGGYTGPLLLQASKRWQGNHQAFRDMPQEVDLEAVDLDEADRLIKASFGCVVGRATFKRWIRRVDGGEDQVDIWLDRHYGFADPPAGDQLKWWTGPWAAVLDEVVEFETPIPCTGMQGIWTVPPEVEAAVNAARIIYR